MAEVARLVRERFGGEAGRMRHRFILSVIAMGGVVAGYVTLARPWQLRWGATGVESGEVLPGDELMTVVDLAATRAITVRAEAGDVWPWVAQLGQGRGGFYSYDRLENMVGCDIHSADTIVPEWQDVRVGDEIWLAPQFGLQVAQVDPGRVLVLRGNGPPGSAETAASPAPPFDFTWAFVIRPEPGGMTRLIVRERYRYLLPWARFLVEPVEALSFIMSRKMLRGIRDRAERAVGSS